MVVVMTPAINIAIEKGMNITMDNVLSVVMDQDMVRVVFTVLDQVAARLLCGPVI
jgi:hypothetical protein